MYLWPCVAVVESVLLLSGGQPQQSKKRFETIFIIIAVVRCTKLLLLFSSETASFIIQLSSIKELYCSRYLTVMWAGTSYVCVRCWLLELCRNNIPERFFCCQKWNFRTLCLVQICVLYFFVLSRICFSSVLAVSSSRWWHCYCWYILGSQAWMLKWTLAIQRSFFFCCLWCTLLRCTVDSGWFVLDFKLFRDRTSEYEDVENIDVWSKD